MCKRDNVPAHSYSQIHLDCRPQPWQLQFCALVQSAKKASGSTDANDLFYIGTAAAHLFQEWNQPHLGLTFDIHSLYCLYVWSCLLFCWPWDSKRQYHISPVSTLAHLATQARRWRGQSWWWWWRKALGSWGCRVTKDLGSTFESWRPLWESIGFLGLVRFEGSHWLAWHMDILWGRLHGTIPAGPVSS